MKIRDTFQQILSTYIHQNGCDILYTSILGTYCNLSMKDNLLKYKLKNTALIYKRKLYHDSDGQHQKSVLKSPIHNCQGILLTFREHPIFTHKFYTTSLTNTCMTNNILFMTMLFGRINNTPQSFKL